MVCLLAPPAWAADVAVPAGGDLQAALDAAQPGDVVLLAPGAVYTGNFKLPVKPGTTFITVRTNARDLPAPGVRVSPAHTGTLAVIKSPNTQPALTTAPAAHHWRFENVEFQANVRGVGDIIVLGASASQTSLAQMPHDLVFDRVYIHGDPAAGQKRGIALNSGATQIINSHISDIKAVGIDTQAIAGWNGSGPFLIQNNYLEGAGENLLFGGADPSVPNLVPSDITIRGNLFSKPLAWRGERWQIKNAFELKNARRVLVEGNIFEHVWGAAQTGFAVVITTRNQDGRAPWSVVEDVTFRYNVIRHAASVFNITGYDDERASEQGKRLLISHNIAYDIDGGRWNGSGIFLQVGNEPRDITVEHNTVMHSGTVISAYGRRNSAPAVIVGFAFRNNMMRHNTYGVKGADLATGLDTLATYFPGFVFERNVLAGGDARYYPAGNYFPSVTEFQNAFTNAAAGDFSLVSESSFRTAASNGGSIGADVSRVNSAVRGADTGSASGAATDEGLALCRPGSDCSQDPPSRRRR
jgi:hypothetical protein